MPVGIRSTLLGTRTGLRNRTSKVGGYLASEHVRVSNAHCNQLRVLKCARTPEYQDFDECAGLQNLLLEVRLEHHPVAVTSVCSC